MYDFTVKYDGNGYRFEVLVNTNEDPGEIAKRIHKAVRGQIRAAGMVTVRKLAPEEVREFMGRLAAMAASGLGTEYKL